MLNKNQLNREFVLELIAPPVTGAGGAPAAGPAGGP